MPVPDGDARLLAEVVEPQELVVDEGLERADVDGPHAGGRVLVEEREDGKERRLRLARGRGGREQDVVVRVEDGLCGGHLDAAKVLPSVAVDEVLHEGGVAVERAHALLRLPAFVLGFFDALLIFVAYRERPPVSASATVLTMAATTNRANMTSAVSGKSDLPCLRRMRT